MSRLAQFIRAAAIAVVACGGLVLLDYLAPLQWPTFFVYAGLVITFCGLLAFVLQPRWFGLARRTHGLATAVGGLAIFAGGLLWPAAAFRTSAQETRLDVYLPTYHFYERHQIDLHAPPDRALAALREVSFDDIGGTVSVLGRIRSIAMGQFHAPPANNLARIPLFEMLSNPRSGFFPLDNTEREFVFGMAGQPWNNRAVRLTPDEYKKWDTPGNVKIAFNFLIEGAGTAGSRLVTETRVYATDDVARVKMAKYWRLIYPGSGMIRRGMLNAVRVRAESTSAQ